MMPRVRAPIMVFPSQILAIFSHLGFDLKWRKPASASADTAAIPSDVDYLNGMTTRGVSRTGHSALQKSPPSLPRTVAPRRNTAPCRPGGRLRKGGRSESQRLESFAMKILVTGSAGHNLEYSRG